MVENQTTMRPSPPLKPGAPLRVAGVIILLVGLLAAGLVYGLSKPADIPPDEMATPDNSKRSARDVAATYGQMSAFSYSLDQDLRDPAVQAGIIAMASIFIAGGCFYIGHLQARDPLNYRRGQSNEAGHHQ